jgi:hypothetical protein
MIFVYTINYITSSAYHEEKGMMMNMQVEFHLRSKLKQVGISCQIIMVPFSHLTAFCTVVYSIQNKTVVYKEMFVCA